MCRLLIAGLALVWSVAQADPGHQKVRVTDDPLAMTAVPLAADEQLRLDGRLDHPAWQRAPVFERFVAKYPQPGEAPPQRTQVRLLFDERALYVGITAFDEQPALIRRPLVRHDQVNRTQDFVVVYVDPIGSRRSAQFFRVNAAGSMADGLHTASDDSEDFAPDFDWDAAVAEHAGGWSAVLRLPFSSLRYAPPGQGQDTLQPWRIMVGRRLPRQDFHLMTSVLVPREVPSFISTLQPLLGVRLPQTAGFLTLRPSITLASGRDRLEGRPTQRERGAEASLDIKWRPRAELVVDATLNPDFSQVALDVPQLSGNTRFALTLAEKRPFFFESADLLRTPTDAFYTRSFTAPRAGLRATWRGPQLAGSALVVDDRGGGLVPLPGAYGTGAAEQPGSRTLAARGRYDEGGAQGLQWGGVLALRRYEQGRGDNLVAGPDLGWTLDENWRLRAQWLQSHSSAQPDADGELVQGQARSGHRAYLRLDRLSDGRESALTLEDIGAGFRHDTGFVGQADVRSLRWFESLGWRGVGPLHEFWINATASRTESRSDGRTVEQQFFPGIWFTGPHNLEAWVELHLLAQQRASAGGPLLAQRYVTLGAVVTPAAWLPLLETEIDIGRLADTNDEQLRQGLRWTTSATLRPHPRLELEPMVSLSGLRGAGRRAYDERLARLLAVWHLGPRSHLRVIVQHGTLAREGLRLQRDLEQSLTWSWRPSAGTVLYAGASRARSDGAQRRRTDEVFVKLQFDFDDVRSAWRTGS